MSDVPAVDEQALEQWFDANVLFLVVIAVALVLLYAYSSRIVHTAVTRALSTQARALEEGSPEAVELQKRAATLEGLITALLRIVIAAVIVTLVIGFFGLWSLLAGLGLVLAALTLAGQSIVLDYLMGVLIILEGQYFKGDVIAVGTLAGTVEDVGLRRTTIRGPTARCTPSPTARSAWSRTALASSPRPRSPCPASARRTSSGSSRSWTASAEEVAQDPELADAIIEAPTVQFIGDPDDLGMSATMRGKVVAGQRWAVATEIRKRLNRAFLEEGIELNKRGVAPRVSRASGSDAPLYVPEPGDD